MTKRRRLRDATECVIRACHLITASQEAARATSSALIQGYSGSGKRLATLKLLLLIRSSLKEVWETVVWAIEDEGIIWPTAGVSAVRRAVLMTLSWICAELCPCYGKCATHIRAVQQKEVRWRSRERLNGIQRASEIWWRGTSATVRIIVGEKCILWHLITVSPSQALAFMRAGCVICQPVVFLTSCSLFVWKYKLKYHLWMFCTEMPLCAVRKKEWKVMLTDWDLQLKISDLVKLCTDSKKYRYNLYRNLNWIKLKLSCRHCLYRQNSCIKKKI